MKLGCPGQDRTRSQICAKVNNKTVISIICLHYNFLHSNPVGSYAHHVEA